MALNRKIWEQNAWQIDNYDHWCEGMPEMFPIQMKSNEEIENGYFDSIDLLIKRATPELTSGETNPYFQKPALNYRIEMAHRLKNGWPPIEPKEAQEKMKDWRPKNETNENINPDKNKDESEDKKKEAEKVSLMVSKPEQDKDTHIANLQNKVNELRRYKKFKKLTLSDEELRTLVDKSRKKNGRINYSKLGIALGVKHPTAKSWCDSRGIE